MFCEIVIENFQRTPLLVFVQNRNACCGYQDKSEHLPHFTQVSKARAS